MAQCAATRALGGEPVAATYQCNAEFRVQYNRHYLPEIGWCSEPVAAAFEWNPSSKNHTPWCTVKERYEGCIRQGAHGAEEHPCPGLRTNLQYRRNGARNTGSIRFVLLKMEHKATESATVTLA